MYVLPSNTGPTRVSGYRLTWFQVGGSYDDAGIANISLAWMMGQLEPLLEFDPNYLLDQHRLHVEYCKAQKGGEYKGAVRPWGMSQIYNSKGEGWNRIGWSSPRTPGKYLATDPNTGLPEKRALVHTAETIHASVRIRKVRGGKGENDQGPYTLTGLKDFNLKGTPAEDNVRWEDGSGKILPEDHLNPMERLILQQFPEIEKMVSAD